MDQSFRRDSSDNMNPLIYEMDQQQSQITKMEKARLQKQQVDFHSRKFKVFLALKPILIQQYKQQMRQKFEKEMGIKRALYKYITYITLRTHLRQMASKFVQQRDYNLKRNRRVWSALLIKIRFKRKLKRFGPDLLTRLRTQMAATVVHSTVSIASSVENRAKRVLFEVLTDSARNRQATLKLTLTMTRVLNLQQRARVALARKKKQQRYIKKSITMGLQTMRQAILFDKTLADRYKGLMQLLTSILTLQKHLIADIAIMYMQLPLFIHSVNLVRWYALYRNEGLYNTDTYVTAMTQIKRIVAS